MFYRIAAIALFATLLIPAPTPAQSPADSEEAGLSFEEFAAAFEKQLDYKTGDITLDGGIATIHVPKTFRFLDASGSRKLLVEGWGNPDGAADGVLGMLVPAKVSPMADDGWGVVVTFDESGYVDDADASSIDYDSLLKQMKADSQASNAARVEQGYEAVNLVGWAEPPSYDAENHKLMWAKELEFGGSPDHTLNYAVRILGRRGVLELNAVASMSQLGAIRDRTEEMLAAVDFNEGHRYADYVPGVDKAATYGVVGLIAGAAAVKAGLFKGLIVAVLAAKKFIIIGVIAVGGLLVKMFGGGKAAE